MLVSSFKQRAADEGITLPNNFYMIDISLMNDFDENQIEKGFWSDIQNVNLGEYIFWPMGLAGLYDARSYQEPERSQMANSTVWEFDHLPDRAQQLMMMMHTPGPIDPATGQPRPKVIFAHCQGMFYFIPFHFIFFLSRFIQHNKHILFHFSPLLHHHHCFQHCI